MNGDAGNTSPDALPLPSPSTGITTSSMTSCTRPTAQHTDAKIDQDDGSARSSTSNASIRSTAAASVGMTGCRNDKVLSVGATTPCTADSTASGDGGAAAAMDGAVVGATSGGGKGGGAAPPAKEGDDCSSGSGIDSCITGPAKTDSGSSYTDKAWGFRRGGELARVTFAAAGPLSDAKNTDTTHYQKFRGGVDTGGHSGEIPPSPTPRRAAVRSTPGAARPVAAPTTGGDPTATATATAVPAEAVRHAAAHATALAAWAAIEAGGMTRLDAIAAVAAVAAPAPVPATARAVSDADGLAVGGGGAPPAAEAATGLAVTPDVQAAAVPEGAPVKTATPSGRASPLL